MTSHTEGVNAVGTGMAIFLIIVFVLCVLLLLPIRVKASFGDGKWAVSVYYTFLRVFHKGSAPDKPPEQTESPPAAEDTSEPAADEKPEPAEDVKPEPAENLPEEKPEPADEPVHTSPPEDKPEEKPEDKPEPVSESDDGDDGDPADDAADSPDEPESEPESEKPKKRGFFRRIKPQSLSEGIALGKDALASLSPALKFLTRHFHFRHVKLYLAVGSDDPANTATLYGKICAGAYNLLAALQCWFDLEADEFRILADFYNDSMTFRGALELRVSPAALILTVLMLGVRFLWRTWRRFRREDKEEARKEQETKPLPEQAAA